MALNSPPFISSVDPDSDYRSAVHAESRRSLTEQHPGSETRLSFRLSFAPPLVPLHDSGAAGRAGPQKCGCGGCSYHVAAGGFTLEGHGEGMGKGELQKKGGRLCQRGLLVTCLKKGWRGGSEVTRRLRKITRGSPNFRSR